MDLSIPIVFLHGKFAILYFFTLEFAVAEWQLLSEVPDVIYNKTGIVNIGVIL